MVSRRPFCKSPNQLGSVASAISLSEVTHGDSADCLPSSQLCSPYATGINSLKLPNKLTVIQNKTLSLSTACMLGEEGGGSFSSPSEAMSLMGGVTGVQGLSGEWRHLAKPLQMRKGPRAARPPPSGCFAPGRKGLESEPRQTCGHGGGT